MTKAKYSRLRTWYPRDIVKEMDVHLSDLAVSNTTLEISDPVYAEDSSVKYKTRKEREYIESFDMGAGQRETGRVRRDTEQ